MYIFGFKLPSDDEFWTDDPFSGDGNTPEDVIGEVCHVYWDIYGHKYIGIDMQLGMSMFEMTELLLPHSAELGIHACLD